MIELKAIIKRIDYLPPFPVTVSKALHMLDDPKVTPESIAEVIKFDQAIATNVLRLCNSTYFGLSRSITNLQEALVYIGLSRFREILVLSGTKQYFENKIPGYEATKGELWSYSLSSAIIANELCELLHIESCQEAFLAALLHDLGKLILSEYITESLRDIYARVENEGYTFIEAEKEILGYDHAELGALILEQWGFPKPVIDAVRKHHEASSAGDTVIDDVVRISDTLAIIMGMGTSVDGLTYHGFDDICQKYRLTQDMLDKIMGDSLEKILVIEKEYGVTREET